MSTAETPIPKFNLEAFNRVLKNEIDNHKPTDAVRGLLKSATSDMMRVYQHILPELKNLTTYELYCYSLDTREIVEENIDDFSRNIREDIVRASSLYVRKEMVTLKDSNEGTLEDGLNKIFSKLYGAVRHSELGHNKSSQDIEVFVYKLIIKISIFINPSIVSTISGPISFGKFTLSQSSEERSVSVLDYHFNFKFKLDLQITLLKGNGFIKGSPFQCTINYGCILDDACMRQTKLTDVITLLISKTEELYTEEEMENLEILSLNAFIEKTTLEKSLIKERLKFGNTLDSSLDVSKSKPRLPLQHKLENLISEAIQSSLKRKILSTGGGRKYFSMKRKSSRRNKTRKFGSGY